MKQIIIIVLLSISFHLQADNSSERIKGVADFLIDRANDNYLYIFQKKIQDNKEFKCYFPTTYSNLELGSSVGLKGLLTSRTLWKNAIQKDLENIAVRSLQREITGLLKADINGDKLDKAASKIASDVLNILQLMQVSYGGQQYALNVVPLGADEKTQALINGFSYGVGTSLVNLSKIEPYEKGCDAPPVNFAEFKQQTDLLWQSVKGLYDWLNHIKANAQYLQPSAQGWGAICSTLNVNAASCNSRENTIATIQLHVLNQFLNKVDQDTYHKLETISTMTSQVDNHGDKLVESVVRKALCHELGISAAECSDGDAGLKKLEEIALKSPEKLLNEDVLKKIDIAKSLFSDLQSAGEDTTSKAMEALKKINLILADNPEAYEKLSKYVLFFANVADADSADQVKSILTNYTLPSVSFFAKREDGNHIMLTSYLGVSYNLDEDELANDKNNGIFAPIGFEYSRGVDWLGGYVSSASLMVSPVDFGYPVNLKLNGIEEDIEFDEIAAPSITFAMGFTDYPLTLGIGYQKGRTIEMSNETEDRMIIFFAFDMPLYNFGGD